MSSFADGFPPNAASVAVYFAPELKVVPCNSEIVVKQWRVRHRHPDGSQAAEQEKS